MGQCQNRDFGWPASRCREPLLGRRRVLSLPDIPLLSRFLLRFHRVCSWSCVEMFYGHLVEASGQEMAEDFAWAMNRPSSANRTDDGGDLIPYKFGLPVQKNRWWRALIGMEQKHHGLFREQGVAECEVIQLKDNPARMKGLHSKDGILHTIIKTCGLLWCEDSRIPEPRWPSASELAQLQGPRTDPRDFIERHFGSPVCLLNHSRIGRRSELCRGIIGNAMPVFVYLPHLIWQWTFVPTMGAAVPQDPRMQTSSVVARSSSPGDGAASSRSLFFSIAAARACDSARKKQRRH